MTTSKPSIFHLEVAWVYTNKKKVATWRYLTTNMIIDIKLMMLDAAQVYLCRDFIINILRLRKTILI